jgi:mannose-6-phosphate isomerase-like protein (cupin superfamily)
VESVDVVEAFFWDSGEVGVMTHTTVNYEEVDAVADAMHFLREPLECERLGLTVAECPPGWDGKPHDHAGEGEEEVYLLLSGEATITVEGEDVSLSPGDALRVDPGADRQIHNGDAESRFVIAGAP